jgi:hypothetical protein
VRGAYACPPSLFAMLGDRFLVYSGGNSNTRLKNFEKYWLTLEK